MIKASARKSVLHRDGYACIYCGSELGLTMDHIVPVCRGGTNRQSNLVTACEACNNLRGSRSILTWFRWMNANGLPTGAAFNAVKRAQASRYP
jgi:5-methylcytosine-specific restriction endonuclease McrA